MKHFNQDYSVNRDASGRVRIWRYSDAIGYGDLLLDQPNLITKIGAGLAAAAIAGVPNSAITHIYVGYNNGGDASPTVNDTVSSFSTFAKIPLAFSPSFATTGISGYSNNQAYFTIYVTGSALPNSASIQSLGLVNGSGSSDLLFSKIAFSPVVYDNTHGLAISWGITFQALSS